MASLWLKSLTRGAEMANDIITLLWCILSPLHTNKDPLIDALTCPCAHLHVHVHSEVYLKNCIISFAIDCMFLNRNLCNSSFVNINLSNNWPKKKPSRFGVVFCHWSLNVCRLYNGVDSWLIPKWLASGRSPILTAWPGYKEVRWPAIAEIPRCWLPTSNLEREMRERCWYIMIWFRKI